MDESKAPRPLAVVTGASSGIGYHLARCALFARNLGFDAEVCAAEPRLRLGPQMLLRIAGEAAYVCLTDIGTRWARLIGHRRMIERSS